MHVVKREKNETLVFMQNEQAKDVEVLHDCW